MSGKRTIQRSGTLPEYNIALLGALGVGKSGRYYSACVRGSSNGSIGW